MVSPEKVYDVNIHEVPPNGAQPMQPPPIHPGSPPPPFTAGTNYPESQPQMGYGQPQPQYSQPQYMGQPDPSYAPQQYMYGEQQRGVPQPMQMHSTGPPQPMQMHATGSPQPMMMQQGGVFVPVQMHATGQSMPMQPVGVAQPLQMQPTGIQPMQMQPGANTYQNAMPLQGLNMAAAPVDCPMCHTRALTNINFVAGSSTHLWALITFFFTGCLCFIPYMIDSLKDVQHRCSHCGTLLATWHKGGQTVVHAFV